MKYGSRCRRILVGTATGLIILAIEAVHVSAATVDRIVAVVNNDVITLSELEEAVAEAKVPSERKDPPTGQAGQDQESKKSRIQLQHALLKKMIEKKLQLQFAKKKGVSVSQEELQAALQDIKKRNNFPTDQALKDALATEHLTLEQYKADLREQLLLLKLVNREVRSGVLIDEAELLDYYNRHLGSFSEPESFKVSQIFFGLPANAKPSTVSDVKAKASHVLELLQKGGDFRELARQYSEGAEAASGGNLGYFKVGHLFPEMDQAIAKLQVGQFSGLIQSPSGFHILRLDEKKPAQPKPFEAVKEEVREAVYQQRSDELYQQWIKNLWANAYVEIKW